VVACTRRQREGGLDLEINVLELIVLGFMVAVIAVLTGVAGVQRRGRRLRRRRCERELGCRRDRVRDADQQPANVLLVVRLFLFIVVLLVEQLQWRWWRRRVVTR
jgi:hypothetical protein